MWGRGSVHSAQKIHDKAQWQTHNFTVDGQEEFPRQLSAMLWDWTDTGWPVVEFDAQLWTEEGQQDAASGGLPRF